MTFPVSLNLTPNIKSKPQSMFTKRSPFCHRFVYSCYCCVELSPRSHCLPESVCVPPLVPLSLPSCPKLMIDIWLVHLCKAIDGFGKSMVIVPSFLKKCGRRSFCGPWAQCQLRLWNAQVAKVCFSRDKALNSGAPCKRAIRKIMFSHC